MKKIILLLAILFPIQYLTFANALSTDFIKKTPISVEFTSYDDSSENQVNLDKLVLERHRVWLNFTNAEGAFKQLLIGYVETATNGWDNNFDAVTLDGNKYVDFYSINEDRKLVIQARALPFVKSDLIPLGYRSTIAGDFTIAIDHSDGNLSDQSIYLEDKVTGIVHDLRVSEYTFATTTGTFDNRFLLKYSDKTLGVGDVKKAENDILVSVNAKVINVASFSEAINEISIFDLSGKLLYDNKKIQSTELQIDNLQSGNQILLVKIILQNGNMTTKKIVF